MVKHMKKIELLAPAGNLEAFKAAICAGCDAVYVGGKFFGARSYAGNFSLEELEEAVSYAHLYGVKVYVTINTLVYEDEVKAFEDYIDHLVKIHVDAFIMQDLGMIHLVRTLYPDLEIHASTQMHIHTLEGVLEAERMGFKRVVLARELDIETIRKIKENTRMDLEVFGHGALCMGYSGQCLMSYLVGGRSGNRGTCAQCCRQKYTLLSKEGKQKSTGYLLSTKDLNTLPYLQDFIEAGIHSLKIEGRMKRPEYVYLVTKIYRKAIDAYYQTGKASYTKEDMEALAKIFNRKFTKGYLFAEENSQIVHTYRPNHMGIEIGKVVKQEKDWVTIALTKNQTLSKKDGIRILHEPEDVGLTVYQMYQKRKPIQEARIGEVSFPIKGHVRIGDMVMKTTDFQQVEQIQKAWIEEKRTVPIQGTLIIEENQKIIFRITDGEHTIEVQSKERIVKADKLASTQEMIEKSMRKLGNTIYEYTSLIIRLEEGLFVPVKVLNEIRREATSLLNQARIERKTFSKHSYIVPNLHVEETAETSAYIETMEQYQQVQNIVDIIYAEKNLYEKIKHNPKVHIRLPRVMTKYEICEKFPLVCELGCLYQYPNSDTDFSFGVTNSYSLYFLHTIGVRKITLSYELNHHQIQKIMQGYEKRYGTKPNVEWIVYGYIEAMVLKYKLLQNHQVKEGYLQDKFGNRYPLQPKKDYNILYHYTPLKETNLEKIEALGIHNIRYQFLNEKEITNIVKLKEKS